MSDRLKTDLYTIWDRGRHGISWEDSWVQDFIDDIASDLAAARRFLALTETGREIRWCEEHYCSVDRWPGEACVWAETHEKVHSCRVVTKFLADYLEDTDA